MGAADTLQHQDGGQSRSSTSPGCGVSLWVTAPGFSINWDQTTATIYSSCGAKGAGGLRAIIKERVSTEKENGTYCAITAALDSMFTR